MAAMAGGHNTRGFENEARACWRGAKGSPRCFKETALGIEGEQVHSRDYESTYKRQEVVTQETHFG